MSSLDTGRGFRRSLLASALPFLVCAVATAQTTPIRPNTPDVPVPPKIDVPTLGAGLAPLTADEAVRLALRNQPSIENAQGAYEAAAGRTRQVQSNLGPTVAASGSLTHTNRYRTAGGGTVTNGIVSGVGGGLFTSGALALGVTQLLFDFGRTRDLVRQQRALEQSAAASFTTSQIDVALDVRQRVADLSQARRLVAVSEANVANTQAQLALAEANLASGLYPPADVVQAKTNLATAVSALVIARGDEVAARLVLAQSIGIDPRTPLTVADEAAPTTAPADPTELYTTAFSGRPELRQARRALEATGFALSAARKTNSPSFNASATLNSSGTSDPFANQSSSIGISLDWPFFDSGLTAGAIQEAKGNQRSALANYRATQLTVVNDVGQAYLSLAVAIQRITVAEVGVANATESVRLAVGRYRGGVGGTFLDITNAQSQLYTQQRTLEIARADALRAQASLDRAQGRGL